MNNIKSILFVIVSFFIFSCNKTTETKSKEDGEHKKIELISNKIKVLNFATFHMGFTNDALSIDFDENDEKKIDSVRQIAKLLSVFKPTVIIVETTPNYNKILQENYSIYVKDSSITFKDQNEVELLAFELGRLSETKRIYGIDHKLEYNYNINNDLTNKIDSLTFNTFQANPFASIPELNIFEENLSLMEKLRRMNHPKFLDFLIIANADMLTFVGSEEGFEGADEAAKYYQRNLRIYSNLNRIQLTRQDRVFILSGGSHTAFLNEFMKRSPKYEVVKTLEYLN